MAGRRFFTAEACVFRIITKGQKGMANKSFADVQEFLKGKVILGRKPWLSRPPHLSLHPRTL